MSRPLLVAGLALAASACIAQQHVVSTAASIEATRARAASATDGDQVGRWLLSELLAPGGRPDMAQMARRRLDALPHDGMWASFARGLADDTAGEAREASEAYVATVVASAASPDPAASLVAWVAVRHLQDLRTSVSDLYNRHRGVFDPLLDHPGYLGWRAVAELQEWRATEGYARSGMTDDAYDADIVRRTGCAHVVRLAGPFGHGAVQDRSATYPAERPGPWPSAWPADSMRGTIPHVLSVSQHRCLAVAEEQVQDGVFYAESFFATSGDRDVIVAVQGAVAIWVDDTPVLSRALEEWGSWQRFGAHFRVAGGRHRVLARVLSASASVRILNPDGTPAGVAMDGLPAAPYSMAHPRDLSDPNPIDAITREAAAGQAIARNDPVVGALAAYAAHSEQMDDVASALMEPLTDPPDAAALALELASEFCAGDPALSQDVRASRERTLRDRALASDRNLWRSQLRAVLDAAHKQGLGEAVAPLQALAKAVPAEPLVLEQLAQVYAQLGWRAERLHALMDLTERFPDDVPALIAYLDALDDEGPPSEADRVAARIKRLDPMAEVDLDRALGRHDYSVAVRELERLAKRSPKDRQLAARLADVLTRSGDATTAAHEIEIALTKQPLNEDARFRLADRRFAAGDAGALRRALASALQVGASHDDLRSAIDLVEGATTLDRYRKDGLAVIHEYQEWERSGHRLDGTSARILDYGAIWVHDDGSSDMLEHEIQKIQSQEAINAESEAELPTGLILRMRVVKADGRVLEPEPWPERRRSRSRIWTSGTSSKSSTSRENPTMEPRAASTTVLIGFSGRPTRDTGGANLSSWCRAISLSASRPVATCRHRRSSEKSVCRAALARGSQSSGGARTRQSADHRVFAQCARRMGRVARHDAVASGGCGVGFRASRSPGSNQGALDRRRSAAEVRR